MEVINVDPKEFGLEETKAREISSMFRPMLDKMVELEKKYNEVSALPMGSETSSKAKKLRLEYKKIRIKTEKVHKELKSFYLKGGRFVDGWKNAQILASDGIEGKLLEIENYFEIQEEKRLNKLREERLEAWCKTQHEDFDNMEPKGIELMDDDTWDAYHSGLQTKLQAYIKEKAESELKRIQKEKDDRERNEKLAEENRKLQEELAKKEQEERRLRAESQRIEQEKQDAINEAEQKARMEKEAKEEEERKEAMKGDEEKFNDLIEYLESASFKFSFSNEVSSALFSNVEEQISHVIDYINENIN